MLPESRGNDLLLVVAAPNEAQAVIRANATGRPDADTSSPPVTYQLSPTAALLLTGVSKANAAVSTAMTLTSTPRFGRVISIGIAGTYDPQSAPIGSTIIATRSIFADEGLATPSGFTTIADLGFPVVDPRQGDALEPDAALFASLRPHADTEGPVANVSTCSATDALARDVQARTAAAAEAMEGAAVALAASRADAAFCELRVISNTTGDRDRQQWEIATALERLADLARAVLTTLDT